VSLAPDILHPLQPFAPASRGPVRALGASAGNDGDAGLRFRYQLRADPSALRIPAPRPPRQARELWRHTCFEAFVAGAANGRYLELNFSPSTEWAAYSFAGYRTGMTALELDPPGIEVTRSQGELAVVAHVAGPALLRGLSCAKGTKLRIALSAVIEDGNGGISYWALRHAPGKPDFHHAEGFVIEVTTP